MEKRTVDDQVGVATNRAGEVAVRGAGEARVAEVSRVVASLLLGAQDERRERLRSAAGAADVLGNAVARLRREARRPRRRELLERRRRRHVEGGEPRAAQLGGPWGGALLDPG